MDPRAAKLALARKKLKDHQEKKVVNTNQNVSSDNGKLCEDNISENITIDNNKIFENVQAEENVLMSPNMKTDNMGVDMNFTDILISNKRSLENQISDLQSKLTDVEGYAQNNLSNYNSAKQEILKLESELRKIHEHYTYSQKEIQTKDQALLDSNNLIANLNESNSNLREQLDLTKSFLTAKEAQNASLQSQVDTLQSQLDATLLHVQQLTNGSGDQCHKNVTLEKNEELLQKIDSLEHQLKLMHKERDQINSHYEQYVAELNEQLQSIVTQNEDLSNKLQNLSGRETSLVDQISDMEIRLQNYRKQHEIDEMMIKQIQGINKFQDDYSKLQEEFQKLSEAYADAQRKLQEYEVKLTNYNESKDSECNHENISLTKLNADNTSDKIAAQRATEQNKKLKIDVLELESAFIKMSQDKLDLTEKITAEKYLNRELTLKLAEIEDRAKELSTKLKAKDEEMIRLQVSLREAEKKCEVLSEQENVDENKLDHSQDEEKHEHETCETSRALCSVEPDCNEHSHGSHTKSKMKIEMEDAMLKLQDRFYKIMEEVADLSDEKHRLEHIILQLQNETDTICEYVALYQQQRTLLKKRDIERNAQIQIFQFECNQLKSQLEDLSAILINLMEDPVLSPYFKEESRRCEISKAMNLLTNLKSNTLIDPVRKSTDLKDFYPCSCCSGQLIDV